MLDCAAYHIQFNVFIQKSLIKSIQIWFDQSSSLWFLFEDPNEKREAAVWGSYPHAILSCICVTSHFIGYIRFVTFDLSFCVRFWTRANRSCVWFGLVSQSDWIGNQQSIQITPTHMEIDVSVTQFDTRTGHIRFFASPRYNNSSKKRAARCVVRHTVLFHIFHNQIHHEWNIAVLCTFIFLRCQWTCDVRERVRVYILSPSLSHSLCRSRMNVMKYWNWKA